MKRASIAALLTAALCGVQFAHPPEEPVFEKSEPAEASSASNAPGDTVTWDWTHGPDTRNTSGGFSFSGNPEATGSFNADELNGEAVIHCQALYVQIPGDPPPPLPHPHKALLDADASAHLTFGVSTNPAARGAFEGNVTLMMVQKDGAEITLYESGMRIEAHWLADGKPSPFVVSAFDQEAGKKLKLVNPKPKQNDEIEGNLGLGSEVAYGFQVKAKVSRTVSFSHSVRFQFITKVDVSFAVSDPGFTSAEGSFAAKIGYAVNVKE